MKWNLFVILCQFFLNSEQLQLKQVLILSRHNVRTPLSKTLSQCSPKPWPQWNEKAGFLTPKGALLEGFMGKYFSEWLQQWNLLPETCPTEKDFYVYANTAERTLKSSRAFIDSAFPNCSVTIHHARDIDPIFNPVIHNTTTAYIQEAADIMERRIKKLKLEKQFKYMDDLLNYEHSDLCIKDHNCDLATDKNSVIVKTGSKPNINGPLKICKSAIDSFLMEYYDGMTIENVAWGLLNTEEKWSKILDISYNYHNIIFNSTLLARDISKPLIKYIYDILKTDIKVIFLMGHDANLYTVLNAMDFKEYKLKNQNEFVPIGGKIVFQKWSDNNTNEFLKIEYIYQSSEDMKDGKSLSLEAPPMIHELELNSCKKQQNGLYLWKDFITMLETLILKDETDHM